MNTEKEYKLIGNPACNARFIVSMTGFLQIELKDALCKMRAPFEKIKFTTRDSSALNNPIDITYSSDSASEVFWQVTISKTDATDLQYTIDQANNHMNKILGK